MYQLLKIVHVVTLLRNLNHLISTFSLITFYCNACTYWSIPLKVQLLYQGTKTHGEAINVNAVKFASFDVIFQIIPISETLCTIVKVSFMLIKLLCIFIHFSCVDKSLHLCNNIFFLARFSNKNCSGGRIIYHCIEYPSQTMYILHWMTIGTSSTLVAVSAEHCWLSIKGP